MTMKGRFDMKKTLTIIATAALMASASFAPLAIAQDAAPPAPANPTMSAPATPEAPAASGTSADAASSGQYLTEQSPTQVSANDYIGNKVFTSSDESIGSVTNLILEENGGIVAAVVGVGGVLGVGAKNVAVPMDKLTVTRDTSSGEVRLTTMETAETLKAAPEFMTLAQQRNARNETVPPAADGTTTSSTTP
jgi:sporulation protein YlmC with PRC-barrel domain